MLMPSRYGDPLTEAAIAGVTMPCISIPWRSLPHAAPHTTSPGFAEALAYMGRKLRRQRYWRASERGPLAPESGSALSAGHTGSRRVDFFSASSARSASRAIAS
jgi:hypothetical protein